MAMISLNNNEAKVSSLRTEEKKEETAPAIQETQQPRKITPPASSRKFISYEGLKRPEGSSRQTSSETKKPEAKKPIKPADLQPDPDQRTVTTVEGRVLGYDEKFNPVTDVSMKRNIPENKLEKQKVDNVEASSSLSKIINTVSGNERLNQEFFNYLDQKYANAQRPPEGMDVYQNPQNYSPEQKLARYVDLVKVKAQFEAYKEARLKPHTGQMRTILNQPEVEKDIQQAMETLMEDPTVAGLLSSEYLQGSREILEGKRFQEDTNKYDQAYTDAVNHLRTDLQDQFKSQIVDGGIFRDGVARGVNERTILINYNTALQSFGSVLGADYIAPFQDTIQKHYTEFYSNKVEPLLPDTAGSLNALILNATSNFNVPEAQRDNVGLVTPTIDGQAYKELGLALKTDGFMQVLGGLKIDPQTQKDMNAAGLDPGIPKDGFTAAFLPTVTNIATQVFGTSAAKKADRESFTSTVLKELRPLMERLDGGVDPITFGGLAERVRLSLRRSGSPMAAYGNEVTTALNGLMRGANLTSNKLLDGMYGAGTGFALKDVQALTMLAVGYEGKGLAETKNPEGVLRDGSGDNSGVAKKVFGTENRMWDSGALQRFGTEGLEYYANKFSGDVRTLLPNSVVHNPLIDATAYGKKAVDEVLQNYALAVGKGLFGNDEAAVKEYATNVVRMTYNLNSALKPGGSLDKTYNLAMELASLERGNFFEGSVSVDDQLKTMAKYSTLFLSATRTIHGGVMGAGSFDPSSLASQILTSAQGMSHVMDFVGSKIKPSIDAKILLNIGEYADAAKQLARTTFVKGSGVLSGLIDVAWLPVDIFTFVRNLKAGNLDTAEKIFNGIIIGTDAGVAVDGAVAIARTVIPATVLQSSRFAFLFTGTGGAIMAGLGAAFNLINAGALIGLAIWQNIKAEKEYNKAGDRLDANLKPLTDNTTSDNLKLYPEAGDPWGGDSMRQRLYQMHLDNMYKHDLTPFDWAAVRDANRKRYEAAA